MIIFTPNTVIKSADINLNFADYSEKGFVTPDADWIAPTLTNSWTNYSAQFNEAGYKKDALGFVRLRGLVRDGTDGTSIFTLPTGYRPARQELVPCSSADHYGRLDIATTGTVTPYASTTENTWVCLDNISFEVA